MYESEKDIKTKYTNLNILHASSENSVIVDICDSTKTRLCRNAGLNVVLTKCCSCCLIVATGSGPGWSLELKILLD